MKQIPTGLKEEYIVSNKNIARMKELLSLESVKNALKFIKNEQENMIQEQIEIASTEAPSYHEIKRADLYAKKLRELGLRDVEIDEVYNTSGYIDGSDEGLLLLDAHVDTAFPKGTDLTVRRENGVLYGAGILDNARGLTNVLAVIRAMKICGIQPRKSIVVLGSSREETAQGKSGIEVFLNKPNNIDSAICVDGGHIWGIMYNATYVQWLKCVFHGLGGHPFNTFGKQANPVAAAARAAALISDIHVPKEPKTLFSVLKISDNSPLSAVPSECALYIRYGSPSKKAFDDIGVQIKNCVNKACELETKRWNADTITVTFESYANMPGGCQDVHMPLVESHFLAAQALNEEVFFKETGCTNGNVAISKGIPTITYGSSGRNFNVHKPQEFFYEERAYIATQGLLLTLLMATGVDGSVTSCLNDCNKKWDGKP